MAVLYISEYAQPGVFMGHIIPCGSEPAVNDQTVSIGGTHAESSALKNNTSLVRLEADAICSVSFGTAPVATTTNKRLAAGSAEYFWVQPNLGLKISVISNT